MPPCSDLTEGSISKCQWCVGTTLHRQCVLCSVCEGRGDWRPLCLLFNEHGTGTLRCLQKEMATYRHWSVSLWRDPDDVSHCWILSPDKTEWRLISATLCGWERCFVADQLWLMTRIREEEDWCSWTSRIFRISKLRLKSKLAWNVKANAISAKATAVLPLVNKSWPRPTTHTPLHGAATHWHDREPLWSVLSVW